MLIISKIKQKGKVAICGDCHEQEWRIQNSEPDTFEKARQLDTLQLWEQYQMKWFEKNTQILENMFFLKYTI